MRYLLLVLAFSACSESGAKEAHVPHIVQVHCEMGPRAWQKFNVDVSGVLGDWSVQRGLELLTRTNGTWRFKPVDKPYTVYASNCAVKAR